MIIKSELELRELYGHPSGRAKDKVLSSLDKHAKHFINCSPFVVLSTVNQDGRMDASPRGGESGFVKVSNDNEIVIPDFKGNNRIDSLTNIVETGTIGLLFMIPGINETLRVNGKASISTSDEYLQLFKTESKLPISCVLVSIDELFLHCAKAFMRSKLWNENAQTDPSTFPSIGEMLKDQLGSEGEAESREDMVKRYMKDI